MGAETEPRGRRERSPANAPSVQLLKLKDTNLKTRSEHLLVSHVKRFDFGRPVDCFAIEVFTLSTWQMIV